MATLNVEDYGAVGDGLTDDQAAIQSAIDDAQAGDTVFLPAGQYLIGDPYLSISGETHPDDLTIEGDGELDTEIRMISTGSWSFGIDIDPAGELQGLVIRNLIMDGNRDGFMADGGNAHQIRWDPSSGVTNPSATIRNCYLIDGHHTGIKSNIGGLTIENCTFENTRLQSIGHDPDGATPALIEIRGCYIFDHGDGEGTAYQSWVGIDTSSGESIVEDCVIGPSQGRGIKCSNAYGHDHVYRRLRVLGCDGGGLVTTSPVTGQMTLDDVVVEDCGRVSFGTLRMHQDDGGDFQFNIPSGSQVVVTNCVNDDFAPAGTHVLNGSMLNASDGELYVSHMDAPGSDTAVGLWAGGAASGSELGYYGHFGNTGGATGNLGSLSVGSQEEVEKTDVDTVPVSGDVGVFAGTDDSTSSDTTVSLSSESGSLTTSAGSLDTSLQ
jgi:hypothetical protein